MEPLFSRLNDLSRAASLAALQRIQAIANNPRFVTGALATVITARLMHLAEEHVLEPFTCADTQASLGLSEVDQTIAEQRKETVCANTGETSPQCMEAQQEVMTEQAAQADRRQTLEERCPGDF